MSGEVEHYPGDARVIIQNVKGKRVAYLTALGYITSVQMKADAIEVCRCPLRVALDSTMGKCSTIEELRDHCAEYTRMEPLKVVTWEPFGHGRIAELIEDGPGYPESVGLVFIERSARRT